MEINSNVVNTSFRLFAKIGATSTAMGVDSNEFGIYEKFTKKFSIAVLFSRLGGAYVRRASDGTSSYMGVGIQSKKN